MQLAALSCVLYVMQYFISIIHSYSSTDYGLQILYWTRWKQAAGVLKIKKKKGEEEEEEKLKGARKDQRETE